jgi:very-short-patch-repair endonuclease
VYTNGATPAYREHLRNYNKIRWQKFKICMGVNDKRCVAQKILIRTVCGVLGINSVVEEAKFEWLRGYRKQPYRVDAFFPSINLVVEYDGEQHFFPVQWKGQSEEDAFMQYIQQRQRDKIKERLLEEHGYSVVRFGFFEPVDNSEYVRQRLSNFIIPITTRNSQSVQENNHGQLNSRIQHIQTP